MKRVLLGALAALLLGTVALYSAGWMWAVRARPRRLRRDRARGPAEGDDPKGDHRQPGGTRGPAGRRPPAEGQRAAARNADRRLRNDLSGPARRVRAPGGGTKGGDSVYGGPAPGRPSSAGAGSSLAPAGGGDPRLVSRALPARGGWRPAPPPRKAPRLAPRARLRFLHRRRALLRGRDALRPAAVLGGLQGRLPWSWREGDSGSLSPPSPARGSRPRC